MTTEFGRDLCNQLVQASAREWLVTNGLGGYACGTVSGLLTRRYHGLLIAALKPPVERYLMLTKLDEVVSYGDRAYPLSANRWSSGAIDPQGYLQLERFYLEGTIPVWTYALGSARLEKRIWMEPGQNRTYIRYSLTQAQAPVLLTLKALVNDRDHHHNTHRSNAAWWEPCTTTIPQGICWQAHRDAACLALQVAESGATFTPANNWYLDYELSLERDRGLDAQEDHYHGATIQAQLLPGRSLTVIADALGSLTERQSLQTVSQPEPSQLDQTNGQKILEQQHDRDAALLTQCLTSPAYAMEAGEFPPAWIGQLMLAAHQFLVQRQIGSPHAPHPASETAPELAPNLSPTKTGMSLIAGYPWFSDWGRDTMISLPGLLAHDPGAARPILQTFAQYVDQGMLPNTFPDHGLALARPDLTRQDPDHQNQDADTTVSNPPPPEYNTVDATLWYFEAVRWYYAATQDKALIAELFPVLADIIDWHRRGTRHGIRLDSDGLLRAGEPGVQLTWMDAKVSGEDPSQDWVVTPRIGKPVEINALWYNALLVMWKLAQHLDQPHALYRDLAQQTHQSFQRFWNASAGYCYDVIDGPQGHDDSLRPNQLFALALPLGSRHRASLLTPEQEKALVDICQAELLTPLGLRSLAPRHGDYQGRYGGDRRQRDGAYHQGTVWGWLIGPFIQAHLKVYQDKAQARAFLQGLEAHLVTGCIGTLGEIFDGNAPHAPKGAFAQAWTVAEVLRAWALTQ
jgi:glycogen debranching enzyme